MWCFFDWPFFSGALGVVMSAGGVLSFNDADTRYLYEEGLGDSFVSENCANIVAILMLVQYKICGCRRVPTKIVCDNTSAAAVVDLGKVGGRCKHMRVII